MTVSAIDLDWPALVRDLLAENAQLRENTSGNADTDVDPDSTTGRAQRAIDIVGDADWAELVYQVRTDPKPAPAAAPAKIGAPEWPEILREVLEQLGNLVSPDTSLKYEEAQKAIASARVLLKHWDALPAADERLTRLRQWTVSVTGHTDDGEVLTERYFVKDDIAGAALRAAMSFCEFILGTDDDSTEGDVVEVLLQSGGVQL